jgi:hypothetical protein
MQHHAGGEFMHSLSHCELQALIALIYETAPGAGEAMQRVWEIRDEVEQHVLSLIKGEGWPLRPESKHWL